MCLGSLLGLSTLSPNFVCLAWLKMITFKVAPGSCNLLLGLLFRLIWPCTLWSQDSNRFLGSMMNMTTTLQTGSRKTHTNLEGPKKKNENFGWSVEHYIDIGHLRCASLSSRSSTRIVAHAWCSVAGFTCNYATVTIITNGMSFAIVRHDWDRRIGS